MVEITKLDVGESMSTPFLSIKSSISPALAMAMPFFWGSFLPLEAESGPALPDLKCVAQSAGHDPNGI